MSVLLSTLSEDGVRGVFRRIHKSQSLWWYSRRGRKLNYQFGWQSEHPVLVIESDDWGAERVPGPDVIREMQGTGFYPKNLTAVCDGIERPNDVDRLCDVLNSHKDSGRNPAVITANFVMANPDFLAIRESNYSVFKAKIIDEGWNHEQDSAALWQSYRNGFRSGLIVPQLHGMLHFCPDEWLRKLRQGDAVSLKAFSLQMIGEREDIASVGREGMGAIYHVEAEAINRLVEEGLGAFKRVFGMDSITTIAPCYAWRSPETEEALLLQRIRVMQGREYQILPGWKMKAHYLGERGPGGTLYLVRNCLLEPVDAMTTVEQCIAQIEESFRSGLPAIICSHRMNYSSRVSTKFRDKGLSTLDGVLKQITKEFPDVEFLSSDKLALRILEED